MHRYFWVFYLLLPVSLFAGINTNVIEVEVQNIYPFEIQNASIEILSAPEWLQFEADILFIGSLRKYQKQIVPLKYALLNQNVSKKGTIEIQFKDQMGDVFDSRSISISSVSREKKMGIESVCPNPANPETMIKFRIGDYSFARLEIYNILGQKIRTLFAGNKDAGIYQIKWNGKNDFGNFVSTGIYFARLHISNVNTGNNTNYTYKLLFQK